MLLLIVLWIMTVWEVVKLEWDKLPAELYNGLQFGCTSNSRARTDTRIEGSVCRIYNNNTLILYILRKL